jgi:hypothetical protein
VKVLGKLAAGRLASVELSIHDETEGIPPNRVSLEADFRSISSPRLPNRAMCYGYWPHLVAGFGSGSEVGRRLTGVARRGLDELNPAGIRLTRTQNDDIVAAARVELHVDEYDLWANIERRVRAPDWLILLRPGHVEALGGLELVLNAPCEVVERLEGPDGTSVLLQCTEDIDRFGDEQREILAGFLAPVLRPPPDQPTPAIPEERAAIMAGWAIPDEPDLPRPWETDATTPHEPTVLNVRALHPLEGPDVEFTFSFGGPIDAMAERRLGDVIDGWYREWSNPRAPYGLHSMSDLDFDESERAERPTARLRVDFGDALPGALNDLLRRLDVLASSGVGPETVTLGLEQID